MSLKILNRVIINLLRLLQDRHAHLLEGSWDSARAKQCKTSLRKSRIVVQIISHSNRTSRSPWRQTALHDGATRQNRDKAAQLMTESEYPKGHNVIDQRVIAESIRIQCRICHRQEGAFDVSAQRRSRNY